MPGEPKSLKFTAQGYIKITSTSNNTNNMATRKYLMDMGVKALPITSTPDSNVVNKHYDYHKSQCHYHLENDGQIINRQTLRFHAANIGGNKSNKKALLN